MNILSIDFDFFQKVTEEQLMLYPDGIDNGTALSEVVWGSNYAISGEKLRKIEIMRDEFDIAAEILLNQECNIPVMIANSHIHIYDFINESLPEGEKLHIYNADMHDDFDNGNKKLDCGNWMGYLLKKRNKQGLETTFKWIHNPISLSAFESKMQAIDKFSSLEEIKYKRFDAIFLCRSDTWTPPHLDRYFTEFCDIIKSSFYHIKMEKEIDIPRSEYLKVEAQLKDIYNKNYQKERKNI